MPKIRSSVSTFVVTDNTQIVPILPPHEVDDLLIVFVNKDDGAGGVFTTASIGVGWNFGNNGLRGSTGNNSNRFAWYWKIASSSLEDEPIIESSDPDSWSAVAVSIDNVNLVTPFATHSLTYDDGANPHTAGAVTATTNSLVLFAAGTDGGVSPSSTLGTTLLNISDSASDACAVAWRYMLNSGSTDTCNFLASGTGDETALFTIVVNDDGSKIVPGYPAVTGSIIQQLKGANLPNTNDILSTTATFYLTDLGQGWLPVSLMYQVDISPSTFTDITTAANNATDADVIPYPATDAIGDYVAIGSTQPFNIVRFDRGGCTAGATGVVSWQYLSGSTWKRLNNVWDGTTNFTVAVGDQQLVQFDRPLPSQWPTSSLNGQSYYWIRAVTTTAFGTNPTISQVFIGSGSKGCSYDVLTGQADSGTNPLFDATLVTPLATGNGIAGSTYRMGNIANLNTSSGVLLSSFLFSTPRDYADLGFIRDGGVLFGLVQSGSTESLFNSWVVGGTDSVDTIPDKRNIFAIQPTRQVDTRFAYSGSVDNSLIKAILLASNSRFGPANVAFNQLLFIEKLIIQGGSATAPLSYSDVVNVCNAYPFPIIDKTTNTQWATVQIGGADPVDVNMSLFTLTSPATANTASKTTAFHVDDNVIGLIIYGTSGSAIRITDGLISAGSPSLFTIHPSSSVSASYDFSGLSLINRTVSLQPVTTYDEMAFIRCPSVTQSGSVMNSCTFNISPLLSDNPSVISSCTFIGSGSNHGIIVLNSGSYSFAGNTFSSFGLDDTSGSALFNNSGGPVTMSISSGGGTPTVRNSSGSATLLLNNISVTITGLKDNTEIRILATGTQDELAGIENATDGSTDDRSFTFSLAAGVVVDIQIVNLDYEIERISAYTIPGADASLPIQQRLDRNYLNPV